MSFGHWNADDGPATAKSSASATLTASVTRPIDVTPFDLEMRFVAFLERQGRGQTRRDPNHRKFACLAAAAAGARRPRCGGNDRGVAFRLTSRGRPAVIHDGAC